MGHVRTRPDAQRDPYRLTPNGRDVTKRAIVDINSIVSGWNYDILTSIITKLLTSRPFSDLRLFSCGNVPRRF